MYSPEWSKCIGSFRADQQHNTGRPQYGSSSSSSGPPSSSPSSR